ncbi:MAG: hypothetical protein RLZZ324_314 [Candidatus Parcubacteria bacterium]|jgi:peptidoglycan/xylan/chitin deacetylase (PgdA/CDA1 family)
MRRSHARATAIVVFAGIVLAALWLSLTGRGPASLGEAGAPFDSGTSAILPKSTPLASEKATNAPSRKPVIRLTFDADMTAGMEARLKSGKVTRYYDSALFEYLHAERVPYTVFVTGMFAETYPDIVRAWAVDPDVTVANHTYDHDAFTANCYGLPTTKDDAARRDEIARTQRILTDLGVPTPTWFRFPGLCHDAHDDVMVTEAGLRIAPDDIVSGDPFNTHPERIVAAVLKRAHDGGTVVMHPGGANAPSTTEAVKSLVPDLRARGFTFAKL